MKRYLLIIIICGPLFFSQSTFSKTKPEESMTIIDHQDRNRVELFEKKMSLDKDVLTYSFTNISESSSFGYSVHDVRNTEVLPTLYSYDGPYLVTMLGANVVKSFSHLYSIEILKENKTKDEHLNSIWGMYSEYPTLNTRDVIDKAKTYDDFKETRVDDYTIYSFRFVNEENCKPYYPTSFYLDKHSIVIGDFEDVKAVLLNKSENSLWEKKYNKKRTYNVTNIVDLQKYRTLSSGLMKSVDFSGSLKNILSAELKIEKGDGAVFNLSLNTGKDELAVEELYQDIENHLADLSKRLKNIKKSDGKPLAEALNHLLIEKHDDHLTLKLTVSSEIIDLFYDNLITDIESFIITFPGILGDDGLDFSEDDDDREIEDQIVEDPIVYKEEYFATDFPHIPLDEHYRDLLFSLATGPKKIWFVDKDEQQIAVMVELKSEIPSDFKSFGRFVDFHSPVLMNSSREKIGVDKNCGPFRNDDSSNLDEKRSVNRSVLLQKDKTHQDIGYIGVKLECRFPFTITSKKFTKEDIGKRIYIGSLSFKLLDIGKHSFSYMQSGEKDPILEFRPLNSNGQALTINGYSRRADQLPNGIKRKKMTHYVVGNVDSLEIYYSDHFMYKLLGDLIPANFKKESNAPQGHIEQITPVAFTDIQDRHFDKEKHDWKPLRTTGYIQSRIESGEWKKIEFDAPIELYLEKDHGSSEVVLKFMFLTPGEDIFLRSRTAVTLQLDEVKLTDGTVHKRPTPEEKLEIEKNRHYSYNGITSINWDLQPMFDSGEFSHNSNGITLLGIKKQETDIQTLTGSVTLKLPEKIDFIDIESLFVGDMVKGSGFEAKVIKFENGRFYIRFIKGGDKFVALHAQNMYDKTFRDLKPSFDSDGVLVIRTAHHNEIYQFSYAEKMNIQKFEINFDL